VKVAIAVCIITIVVIVILVSQKRDDIITGKCIIGATCQITTKEACEGVWSSNKICPLLVIDEDLDKMGTCCINSEGNSICADINKAQCIDIDGEFNIGSNCNTWNCEHKVVLADIGDDCGSEQPCSNRFDCISGTCKYHAQEDEMCDELMPCQEPLQCVDKNGIDKCVLYGEEEEFCEFDKECDPVDDLLCIKNRCWRPRERDESCIFEEDCVPGLECLNGKCGTKQPEGELCETNANCLEDLVCLTLDGESKCWRPRNTEEICSDNAECASGLKCLPNNTCGNYTPKGGACDLNSYCDPGNICKNGACMIPIEAGEPCSNRIQCDHGYTCADRSLTSNYANEPTICALEVGQGGDCDKDNRCQEGLSCLGGICTILKSLNQSCSSTAECWQDGSDNSSQRECRSGKCIKVNDIECTNYPCISGKICGSVALITPSIMGNIYSLFQNACLPYTDGSKHYAIIKNKYSGEYLGIDHTNNKMMSVSNLPNNLDTYQYDIKWHVRREGNNLILWRTTKNARCIDENGTLHQQWCREYSDLGTKWRWNNNSKRLTNYYRGDKICIGDNPNSGIIVGSYCPWAGDDTKWDVYIIQNV